MTKRFGLRAGFFPAMPRGSRLRHALDQLLIEGAPLQAGQGQRSRRGAVLVMGFEFGPWNRAQTSSAVHVEVGL